MDQHHQPGREAESNPNRPLRVRHERDGEPPEATDSPFAVERLDVLAHELSNLVDGSIRCLYLARRSLSTAESASEQLDAARRQIETVYSALERMAEVITTAMRSGVGGGTLAAPAPGNPQSAAVTLDEALHHAADVVRPLAAERGIEVRVHIAPEAGELPAGPLYSPVLNGLHNAIEAIQRAQSSPPRVPGGLIEVLASTTPPDAVGIAMVQVEIRDDGCGVAASQARRAFEVGVSSKPQSLGLGLALTRELVRQAGGSVELAPNPERTLSLRPGAVLRIDCPVVITGA